MLQIFKMSLSEYQALIQESPHVDVETEVFLESVATSLKVKSGCLLAFYQILSEEGFEKLIPLYILL